MKSAPRGHAVAQGMGDGAFPESGPTGLGQNQRGLTIRLLPARKPVCGSSGRESTQEIAHQDRRISHHEGVGVVAGAVPVWTAGVVVALVDVYEGAADADMKPLMSRLAVVRRWGA